MMASASGHHGFVAVEYLQRGILGCEVDDIVQRIKPGQPMPDAELDLAMSDVDGVRQEHVGACQIDLVIPGASRVARCTRAPE